MADLQVWRSHFGEVLSSGSGQSISLAVQAPARLQSAVIEEAVVEETAAPSSHTLRPAPEAVATRNLNFLPPNETSPGTARKHGDTLRVGRTRGRLNEALVTLLLADRASNACTPANAPQGTQGDPTSHRRLVGAVANAPQQPLTPAAWNDLWSEWGCDVQ
jgi:hypothetical protein